MDVSSLLSERQDRRAQRLPPKTVAFELLLDEGSKTRARIPLRILVNQHDDDQSIVTTVKNFYGIYDGHGVSFEDVNGNILIANHENLADHSLVYVRTVAGPEQAPGLSTLGPWSGTLEPPRKTSLGEPFEMAPPSFHDQVYSPSRPSSRLARKRSSSPIYGRGRRSASQHHSGSVPVSRGSSVNGSYHEDGHDYSDSDAGRSSLTGSKRARSEQFASADISLDNVVQEGRRVKSLFDSSELPLFVPPQVPVTTSISSVSPQRRALPQDGPSPYHHIPNLPTYNLPPLPSPRSNTYTGPGLSSASAQQTPTQPPGTYGHRLRDRVQVPIHGPTGTAKAGYNSNGVLPTPDPTVASCISDEDVARQLIALSDMSNFSHGRTSNSTLEDTFSGVADAASSTGATSDSEDFTDDDHHHLQDGDGEYIKSERDEYEGEPKTKKIKTKMHDGPNNRISKSAMKGMRPGKIRSNTLPKVSKHSNGGLVKMPTAPATPNDIRKTSSSSSTLNFQHQLGIDEEDLSSKPRCQRCRKSKKGCDRQRPCGRCKDAGIGIDGCVSEDEGNGRKGRYGRHMGVPVKKGSESIKSEDESPMAGMILTEMSGGQDSPDKSKKRKR